MDPLLVRVKLFKGTTGAFGYFTARGPTSANFHPDSCVCQKKETGTYAGTPHQHYQDPPYRCARCSECDGYEPAFPFFWEARVLEVIFEAIGLE